MDEAKRARLVNRLRDEVKKMVDSEGDITVKDLRKIISGLNDALDGDLPISFGQPVQMKMTNQDQDQKRETIYQNRLDKVREILRLLDVEQDHWEREAVSIVMIVLGTLFPSGNIGLRID
jgi:replication initiation and membrane attachment protein DnaB